MIIVYLRNGRRTFLYRLLWLDPMKRGFFVEEDDICKKKKDNQIRRIISEIDD